MADNVNITPGTGATVAADDVDGKLHQRVKISLGADGTAADLAPGQAVSAASVPVVIASDQSAVPVSDGGGALTVDGAVTVSGTVTATGPLTDTQLRASAVPVSGTVTATGPLTDTQLRAAAVPVSDGGATLTVDGTVTATGPVTNTELRASPVPISGTVTASGPLTDTQLRATAVPVSGTVAVTNANLTTIAGAVAGSEMQVDVLTSALPTGAATSANQTTIIGHVDGIEGSLSTIAGKDFATQTTLAALNAKLVTGTDIGDVTVNNAAGAAAVNVQDGGNSLTVDGTVGVSGNVAVTNAGITTLAGAVAGTEMQVDIVAALPAGTSTIGATTDGGPAWASVFGVSGAAVVSADATTATAVTDAPTSGQKLVIVDIIASSDTALSILFEEETSGTDIFKVFVPASGTVQITPRGKVKLATANKKLTAKTSAAGNVAFTVTYYSEA